MQVAPVLLYKLLLKNKVFKIDKFNFVGQISFTVDQQLLSSSSGAANVTKIICFGPQPYLILVCSDNHLCSDKTKMCSDKT